MYIVSVSSCTAFQSTLPTRGSDGFVQSPCPLQYTVSIHAPHEGERRTATHLPALGLVVSIHAPHEGERPSAHHSQKHDKSVSIHAPHEGERPPHGDKIFAILLVSIHAPHEGERPCRAGLGGACMGVSIHAPHEGERHCPYCAGHKGGKGFNPRSPRGGATQPPSLTTPTILRFQSTLPTRGSDTKSAADTRQRRVSIHAPHEGERRCLSARVCP